MNVRKLRRCLRCCEEAQTLAKSGAIRAGLTRESCGVGVEIGLS
jgi:hypothetical protein